MKIAKTTITRTITLVLLLSGSSLMAAPTLNITCTKAPYSVDIQTVSSEQAVFSLKKDSIIVGTGDLKVLEGGYEASLLNAYILGFQAADDKAVILVGIPNLKELTTGTHEAKSDLIVISNEHVMEGSTLPCTVLVN